MDGAFTWACIPMLVRECMAQSHNIQVRYKCDRHRQQTITGGNYSFWYVCLKSNIMVAVRMILLDKFQTVFRIADTQVKIILN